MTDVIVFLTNNAADFGVLVLAVLGAFSIIAKWTPTEIDNQIVDFLLKIVHTIGLTKK